MPLLLMLTMGVMVDVSGDMPAESPYPIALVPNAQFFVDDTAERTVDDILELADARLSVTDKRQISLGLTRAALWIKIDRQILNAEDGRRLLVVPIPIIDHIDVFVQLNGQWQHQVGGDRSAFSARPVMHRLYVFPLPSATVENVLIKLSGDTPVRFEGYLTNPLGLQALETRSLLIRGLFYGLIIALFLYNLFLSLLAVRDASQLYYLSYLGSAGAVTAILDGLPAFYGRWHWWPSVANEIAILLAYLLLFSGVNFVRCYLRTAFSPQPGRDPLAWLSYALVLCAFASTLVGGLTGQALLISAVATTILILLSTIGYQAVTGSRQAKILGVTFAGLAIPAGLWFCAVSGLLPDAGIRESVLHIGFGLEAILLALALADRINQLKQQQLAAEKALAANQRMFAQQLIHAQETERQAIARDLHDSIGQSVLALKTRFDRWARDADDSLSERYQQSSSIAADVITTTRELAHRLHPSILDRLGLCKALENLTQVLSDAGITVQSDLIPALDALDADTTLATYRIVQEAISNVMRHAQATTCTVAAIQRGALIEVAISDDGTGGASAADPLHSFGTSSMKERANMVGGTLEISDTIGGGTRVLLIIPVHSQQDTDGSENPDC